MYGAKNREKALQRLTKALSEYHVGGVKTNLNFLRKLVTSKAFIEENIDTSFIEKHHDEIFNRETNDVVSAEVLNSLIKSAVLILLSQAKANNTLSTTDATSPWDQTNAWQLNDKCIHNITLELNSNEYNLTVEEAIENKSEPNKVNYLVSLNNTTHKCYGLIDNNLLTTTIDGIKSSVLATLENNNATLYTNQGATTIHHVQPDLGEHGDDESHGGLLAPMNGTMVSILVESGDIVSKISHLLLWKP